ncbi:MAG: helix-turn-helix transcriptional regulator [Bacteroidota bacterium]
MIAIEVGLMVIAYTALIISLFLQIVCYKRKLESRETIAFTVSLLLLIISISLSVVWTPDSSDEAPSMLILLAMILVGLTTPLNVFQERKIDLHPYWRKGVIAISILLATAVLIGYLMGTLFILQFIVAVFLGLSVVGSMILVRRTKPEKKMLHREKAERIFAGAFVVILPLSLLAQFIVDPENGLQFGFVFPLVFILLAGNKILDDLKRLSLLPSETNVQEQHFDNFTLTKREREIAALLARGTTYKEIAEQLFISLPTVKTHASNIYRKCQVKNRSELMALLVN